MRLIDADKLFPNGAVPFITDDGFRTAEKILRIVKKAPTIDAVEVVRCKNCHNYNASGCCVGFGWCENLGIGTDDDFFCAVGERKNT